MSPDLGYLRDILMSGKRALSYIEGQSADDFMLDVRTQDAVLWRLAIIGEAANRMTRATQDAIELPWSQIIGMRHIAIHHYEKLQMPRVWSAVRDRVPELIARVEEFLQDTP